MIKPHTISYLKISLCCELCA